MAEEPGPAPKIEKIVFQAKMSGTVDQIRERVKALPFYAIYAQADSITIARIESRNIRKLPYLFYIVEMKPGEMEVSYSIPQEISDIMRRATVLRSISSLISLISDYYTIDQGKFLQYIDSTMDSILKGLSQPYSALFNQYNSLVSEYRALKRLNVELSASNRNLTVQAEQLTEENKKMGEELKKLQKYSDESLMVMVQDWIEVHNNSIDINEFAKSYGIASPRVEEILDKMVSLGYLELRN
ncbi:MAG TPA: hypothetical protein VL945_02285 [Candidatus Saccharimonadales bacterium]|nr:hypothetical protein [Candidatus Saccharimonadales bacterium]